MKTKCQHRKGYVLSFESLSVFEPLCETIHRPGKENPCLGCFQKRKKLKKLCHVTSH